MLDKSLFSKIGHIGVVVSDIDKAIECYQSLGIGPFEPEEIVPVVELNIMGKPVSQDSIDLKERAADMGTVRLELIEPGPRGSIWGQFLETKGAGIHHLGFVVDDIDKATAEMEEKGYKAIYFSKEANGNGGAYFDTADVGGNIIELRNF